MSLGKRNAAVMLSVALISALLLSACSGAARPTAPVGTGGSASDKLAGGAQEEKTRSLEVAGLKFSVPDSNVVWPSKLTQDGRTPKYGGTINFVHPADPPSMDPSHTTSYLTTRIASHAYERLLHWPIEAGSDPYAAKMVPGLAESWEMSKDGLTYTFKLRKGVKWANVEPTKGREFTADDVVFTHEYYSRPKSVIKAGLWETVVKVDAPDTHTAVFHLARPMKDFLPEISSPVVGLMVPKEVIERDGDLKKVLVGTGPFYSLEGIKPKIGMEFKRNADYWMKDQKGNQLPFVDGLNLHVVPDQSARQAAMRTGKLDWGAEFSTPTQLKAFQRTNPNVYGQEQITGYGGQGWAFRHDRQDAPYHDVRVRRAIVSAIDFKELSLTVSEVPSPELHVSIRGFWTKDGADTLENLAKVVPWYTFDPERSKKLLAEAGFANGFKTTVEFFEYSKLDVSRAEMLAAYLKKVGIEVELRNMEYTVFRANVDTAGWTDLGYTFPFPNRMDIDSQLNFVHSKGLGIGTQGKYADPDVDQWVEKFWASNDEAERMDLLKKIRHRTLDNVAIIPLAATPSFNAIQPWVRDFQPEINAFFPGKDRRGHALAWFDDAWRNK